MEKLHDLLRHYIARSGNTIYGLAKQSGVNRSTLQKIILGNMKLSGEILAKILPELKLSPAEQQKLCLFQQMQALGNDTYREYVALRKFLEQVSERIGRQLSAECSGTRGLPPAAAMQDASCGQNFPYSDATVRDKARLFPASTPPHTPSRLLWSSFRKRRFLRRRIFWRTVARSHAALAPAASGKHPRHIP